MKTITSLQKLGLTKTEVDVYLFLLKNGSSFGSNIHTTLGIDKSSCYRAINNLLRLKLIDRTGISKNKMFFINDVNKLNDLIDDKEKEIINIRSSFKDLLEDINKNRDELYKSENIEIFEGIEGYKLWNERRLMGSHKLVKELGTRKFLEQIINTDIYMPYMKAYISRRIKKGITMYSLHDISEEHDTIDITDKKLLKEARQYQGKLELDAFISLFGNYFGYYTYKNNKFMGVIIQDPLLSRMIGSLFDVIWNMSKPNYLNK